MGAIGKVSAIFTASTSGLIAGVDRAATSMRKMEGSVASLSNSMRFLAAAKGAEILGNVANTAFGYAKQLVDMGRAQADIIDQQSKLADRLGMTHGELAGLALAGDLAGVGLDTIAKAVTKADIAFVKAQGGSKQAQQAFQVLGLSLEEMAGKSSSERFSAMADAVAALPSPAHRAAAAVALFGKSGADLLPLFGEGSGAIAEAVAQADKLGLALNTSQRKDVEAMNDAFTMASTSIKGVVTQVVSHLAPAVKGIADTFTDFVGSMGGGNIGQAIGDGILSGARYFAAVGDAFIANTSGLLDFAGGVSKFLGGVMDAGYRVGNLFYGAFKFFEIVGNSIGVIISSVVEKLLRAAGNAAALIPGFGDTSKSLLAGADVMAAKVEQYKEAGTRNMESMGNAFMAAVKTGETVTGPGPLSTALEAGIAKTRANMSATEARSVGVQEMMRGSPGVDPAVAENQLRVLEAIRDALQGPEEQVSVEF